MTAREHNRTVGILFLVYTGLQIFGLIIAAVVGVVLGGIAMAEISASNNDAVPILFVGVGVIVALFISALLLIPVGMAGWKMFNEKPNAKTWGIVGAVIALLNVPLGMALGIYALWFILGEQGKQFYDNGGNLTAFSQPPPPNSWQ